MRPRKYDIRKEHLEQMRAAGMGRNAIADVYGCDPSTITYWLKKHGLSTAADEPPVVLSDDQVSRAIDRYQKAFSRRVSH